MKEKILLEGVMPERAFNRLARSGVAVERVKRLGKNQTVFFVDFKDSEKVFALYPSSSPVAAYTAKSLGRVGALAALERLKTRVGLLLGGLLFLLVTLYADTLVLKIDVRTDTPLQTEISRVLDENGVREFAPFSEENADMISAQILALDGVSFCSLKKVGSVCVVEVRGSSFTDVEKRANVLTAERTGILTSLTVLRGEKLVLEGAEVEAGTAIAKADGVENFVVARACLSCVCENVFESMDEERAFAESYLAVGGEDERIRITKTEVKTQEEKTFVRIEYEFVFSVNYT